MAKASKVFLSYARSDQQLVQKVAGELRDAGFEVWDPELEILPGADFTKELKSALESADAMVVFISPEAMQTRSVSHEIQYALGAEHLSGRLIPVSMKPTKDAPWIFKHLPSVDYGGPKKTGQQIAQMLSDPPYVLEAKSRAS